MSTWRRLEGDNVDPEMTEGLSARIADPLWTLARQWQVGEFHGEDAASPILVHATVDAAPITAVQIGKQRRATGPFVPLESFVEREPIRDGPAAARIALERGAALLRRLRTSGLGDAAEALRRAYPVDLGLFDDLGDDLDPVGAARIRLLGPRSIAVERLGAELRRAGGDATRLPAVRSLRVDRSATAAHIEAWAAAEAAVFEEPGDVGGAWIDDRLEYRFRIVAQAADSSVVLAAPEYIGGNLDWFHVDIEAVQKRKASRDPQAAAGSTDLTSAEVEVLTSPLQYAGQPASRFWEFEDGDVSFGDLAGGPEDLARSVIAAFGAMAGDDWLLVPVTLPVGSVAKVRTVHILDDFGGRHLITSAAVADRRAAEAGLGPASRPWRFFELSGDPSVTAAKPSAPMLFLPPVIDTLETSAPLEAVEFRRDEMANLAWAIERRVESSWGRAVDRDATIAKQPAPQPDVWDFTLTTTVPPSWVPLVPVQRSGDEWPQMVLRRGRIAHRDALSDAMGGQQATDPQSVLLDTDAPFILQEEEIPHGGLRVARRWQMARDHAGGVHLWVGRTKRPASGPMRRTPLQFDRLRLGKDPGSR